MLSGSSVAAPEGRLALVATSRSLSRISGELPTMVRVPPSTIDTATGSSSRDRLTPVRDDRRETTGRYSAITDGFCITDELSPAMPETSSSRRSSAPRARRSSQAARRLRAPVRSRPMPRIIVAMTLITALEEKPLNRSSGCTRPVRPSITSTTSATRSARTRWNTNNTMVRPTSPSTIFMSVVSASWGSISVGIRDARAGNRHDPPSGPTRPAQGPAAAAVASGEAAGSCLRRSPAVVQQVPDPMAEALAAGFEMGLRAPFGTRDVATRAGAVDQPRGGVEHVPHLFGVVLAVGGQVQASVRRELAHQQCGERGLHQPALVVALLVPGVGEVDAHFVEAGVGDLV